MDRAWTSVVVNALSCDVNLDHFLSVVVDVLETDFFFYGDPSFVRSNYIYNYTNEPNKLNFFTY